MLPECVEATEQGRLETSTKLRGLKRPILAMDASTWARMPPDGPLKLHASALHAFPRVAEVVCLNSHHRPDYDG